jgi:adenylate kinase
MRKVLKLGFFGPPGAGKGTQADRLASYLDCPHISTGDMFRALKTSSTELAGQVQEIIGSGRLVPDELVTEMTLARLAQHDCSSGFILDGFPRTLVQAIALQDSSKALDALIEIRLGRDEIIQRLSGRRVCTKCHAVYHVRDLANGFESACTICGGMLMQRDDDLPEAVATRLDVFEYNIAPLIKFFKDRELLLSIDGYGDPDEVFKRLLKGLEQIRT